MLAAIVTNSPVPHTPGHYFWWYAGLAIGFGVIVIVVVVVATILALAARIGAQARAGIDAMDSAREQTLAIWEVQEINIALTGIWKAAEAARNVLAHKVEESRR